MRVPRWAWCPTCKTWVGSIPPMDPPYWSNEKAAALHKGGTGHKVELFNLKELVA